jgi:diguanylate cyclase
MASSREDNGTEHELKRVNRAHRTLSAGNRTLLRATEEQELLREMCRVIVKLGGYRMAWVGYAQHDEQKTIRPMAYAGFEDGFLDRPGITWADTKRGTAAMAIGTGNPCVGRNVLTDPDFSAWREEALKRGYASVSSFPLHIDSEVLGNLTIFAAEPDAFDEAEFELLSELADDLAFGIATLRMRIKQRQAEETVRHIAYYDAPTGLPNRAHLTERLEAAIPAAKQQHWSLALLILNIDRFREINEVIGYRQGDKLLHDVGMRLQSVLLEPSSLACIGIDEFAILLPKSDAEHAIQIAERTLSALDEPFELSGTKIDVRASIGVALFPRHGTEPDLLILRADAAMYQAKRAHSGYAVYKGDTEQESLNRLALICDLRHGIDDNQLLLYCQPKVHMRTRTVCGAEALVRWQHPQHGLMPPDRFIPLAEHTGLIRPLTYWVLNAALGQCYAWHEAGLAVPLAVNVSARNLRDPKLLERVTGLLTTWGGTPDWLQLELTESTLMDDPAGALEVLNRLRQTGIKLFVDDFGIGYSSLSYLHKLPINAVKIDKSFTLDIGAKEDSLVIVRSTIDLAHNLGFEVVAEGTENQVIWDRLVSMDCDVAQGSYISAPIPATGLLDWQKQSSWSLGRPR